MGLTGVGQVLVLPHCLLAGDAFDILVELDPHALDRHWAHPSSQGREHFVKHFDRAGRVWRRGEASLRGIGVEAVVETLVCQITNAARPSSIGRELAARIDLIVEPEYLSVRIGQLKVLNQMGETPGEIDRGL